MRRSLRVGFGICLAVIAGSMDAAGLSMTGRFTSHMTGTMTHALSRLVAGEASPMLLGLEAILAFLAGAGRAGVILGGFPKSRAPAVMVILLGLETTLILTGGLVVAVAGGKHLAGIVVVALSAGAMGMQNALSSKLLGPFERTTHLTSALTDCGAELGLRLQRVARPATEAHGGHTMPDRGTLFSSGAVILGFASGGLLGAMGALRLGDAVGPVLAILPCCAWTASAVLAMRRGGRADR